MAAPAPIERHFVCVGAQKAGTTWLARALSAHPDLFVTPVKEIHYFDHLAGLSTQLSDRKRRSRYRKYWQRRLTQWTRHAQYRSERDWYRAYMSQPIDDAWYASLFALRGQASHAGEATPEYALLDAAGFRHLQRLSPDVRLIFILRNPVARAWSQILHRCRRLRIDARRAASDRLLALTAEPTFPLFGDYRRTLFAIGEVFPPEQLCVAFYEDLHADRAAGLDRLSRFIGVGGYEPAGAALSRRHNPSQAAEMPDAVRAALRNGAREQVDWVLARLGRVPSEWEMEFGL